MNWPLYAANNYLRAAIKRCDNALRLYRDACRYGNQEDADRYKRSYEFHCERIRIHLDRMKKAI